MLSPRLWRWLLGSVVVVGCLAAGGALVGRYWLIRQAYVEMPTGGAAGEQMDPDALERMAKQLMAQQTDALLIARHGRLLIERYGPNRFFHLPPDSRRRGGASISKGLLGGTVLAIAVCEGWFDPDGAVDEHLKAWRDAGRPPTVTLRHLAEHSSGLGDASRESDPRAPQPDWGVRYWLHRAMRADLALHAAPLVGEPGRVVSYSNPGYTILAMAVAQALARHDPRSDVRDVVRSRLMEPLAIPSRAWSMGKPQAVPGSDVEYFELGSGARFTARALARVGELIAADGRWGDRQLIDAACLREVTTPTPGLAPNEAWSPRQPVPSAGWWTNARGVWPELPRDLLIAAGAEHRVVVIVPSLDLVAVRLGRRLSFDGFADEFWQRLRTDLLQPLIAAVRELPEAPVPTAVGTPSVRGG